ncbi:MAG: PAS domain S-box protein [Myxococcaceae bacterium]|nr:PAS domain S-box protein [Myxococcaceae bacterium]
MELNLDPFDVLVFEVDRHPLALRKISGPLVGHLGLKALGGEFLSEEVLAETLSAVAADGLPRSVHHQTVGADGAPIWLFTQVVARNDQVLVGLSIAVERPDRGLAARGLKVDPCFAERVLDGIPDAVVAQDVEGKIVYASEPAARLLGFRSARELTSKDLGRLAGRYELFDEAGQPIAPEQTPARQALRGLTVPPMRVRWRVRDRLGEFRWATIRATPVFGHDGRVAGVVSIWKDITEQKLREESFDFQRVLLEAQSEASPDGVLIVGQDGQVLSHNRRFREIWGLTREEVDHSRDETLINRVLSQLKDPEGFVARVRALYQGAEPAATDEIGFKDGRIIERYSTQLVPDQGKQPYGRIWFFRDVTQMRRAEERERILEVERATRATAERAQRSAAFLAEASRLLAGSLELSPLMAALAEAMAAHFYAWVVIDVVTTDDRVRRAAAAPAGGPPEVVRALERQPPKSGAQLLGGRFVQNEPEIVLGVAGLLDDPVRRLPWLVAPSGVDDPDLRHLHLSGYLSLPIPVHGKVCGALTVGFERPGALEGSHLRELGQSIAERLGMAVENSQLYDRVREALRVRDEFLTIASHELRTPVATLQLLAQGLLRAAERPGGEGLERLLPRLKSIERQCRRLGVLVGRLLDVSRMSGGPLQLQREPMDLADVTREVTDAFHDELAAAGCVVTLQADRAVEGRWDRARVEEVLSAILSNAALYGRGKPVEIRVGQRGTRAFVEVADHGIGVPPDAVERIFHRFERAADPIAYTGFGLGLFVARKLTDAMGGTIDVEPTAGGGSTFRIELPTDAAEETRAAPVSQAATGSDQPTPP